MDEKKTVVASENVMVQQNFKQRLITALSGKWRLLPVVVILTVIFVIFGSISSSFLSARNLFNLLLQIAQMATISLGLFFVLLLGEIDLAVASSSAVCGMCCAYASTILGWGLVPSLLVGAAAGAVIGYVQGSIVTKFNAPAFLVTLGGQLFYRGVLLKFLPAENYISVIGLPISKLTSYILPTQISFLIVAVFTLIIFFLQYQTYRSTKLIGSPYNIVRMVVVPVILTVVIGVAFIILMSSYSGVSLAIVIVFTLLAIMAYLTTQTHFGISLYAIGGNKQAALRAGMNVNRTRRLAFAIEGLLVGIGGVIATTRVQSVSLSSIDDTVQMEAIAAAVLGGASLNGGRGKAWAVLLGALIMGSISNGLYLVGASTALRYMISGLILVLAIALDSSIAKATQSGS